MKTKPSYRDVVVYVGNVRYCPSQNFALILDCTKVGGWQLWYKWSGVERLIGSEFGAEPVCIEVAGTIILGEKPDHVEDPTPFGWSGIVERDGGGVRLE